MRRRIFLSHGHDEHAGMARRVKTDLEASGHEVWFDEERILPGEDWEACIERGIEWVANDPALGRVVLLMTPHAVRRPDGYCLNELSRAMMRGLRVVPVMLVWCEPPLSICRIQWLDFRDCLVAGDVAASYVGRLERLASAIESDRLDFDGMQARLLSELQPLPFDSELNEHLQRFTGRRWMVDAVRAWLDDPGAERVFWITGPPGIGKTALAARLASTLPGVVAVHLCRFGHSQKADARRCVMSIAYQLSTQLPAYEQRLNALHLSRLIEDSDAGTLFDRLILQPLCDIHPDPGRTLVVLIDALDEATQDGRNPLASLLGREFARTPRWLRLVVTSRPDLEVTYPLQAITARNLDAASAANVVDLHGFIRRELRSHLLDVRQPDLVVETIVSRSEGSFLYAEWLRREIVAGRMALDEVDRFPRGLGGAYAAFADRQWPDIASYKRDVEPVLAVIAAARDPLSMPVLAFMFGWNERQVQEFTRSLGSLFVMSDEGISSFHKSLLDWLSDPRRAGPYWIDVKEGHARLAAFGMELFKSPDQLDGRMAGLLQSDAWDRSFPVHVKHAGRLSQLAGHLADPATIRRRLLIGSDAGEDRRRTARQSFERLVRQVAQLWPEETDAGPLWRIVESLAQASWRSADTDWDWRGLIVWDDIGRPPHAFDDFRAVFQRYDEWKEGILLLATTLEVTLSIAAARPELVPSLLATMDQRLLDFMTTGANGVAHELLVGTAGAEYIPDRNLSFLRGVTQRIVGRFKDDPRLGSWSQQWSGYL